MLDRTSECYAEAQRMTGFSLRVDEMRVEVEERFKVFCKLCLGFILKRIGRG